MSLYLTKILCSYIKGVMRYPGGRPDPPPPVSDVVPKPLVFEWLTFHKLFEKLLVMGGGGHSNSTFYSVELCVMINFSLQHNVLCLSFVAVLYSMYNLYAVIKIVLLDGRSRHV